MGEEYKIVGAMEQWWEKGIHGTPGVIWQTRGNFSSAGTSLKSTNVCTFIREEHATNRHTPISITVTICCYLALYACTYYSNQFSPFIQDSTLTTPNDCFLFSCNSRNIWFLCSIIKVRSYVYAEMSVFVCEQVKTRNMNLQKIYHIFLVVKHFYLF